MSSSSQVEKSKVFAKFLGVFHQYMCHLSNVLLSYIYCICTSLVNRKLSNNFSPLIQFSVTLIAFFNLLCCTRASDQPRGEIRVDGEQRPASSARAGQAQGHHGQDRRLRCSGQQYCQYVCCHNTVFSSKAAPLSVYQHQCCHNTVFSSKAAPLSVYQHQCCHNTVFSSKAAPLSVYQHQCCHNTVFSSKAAPLSVYQHQCCHYTVFSSKAVPQVWTSTSAVPMKWLMVPE